MQILGQNFNFLHLTLASRNYKKQKLSTSPLPWKKSARGQAQAWIQKLVFQIKTVYLIFKELNLGH